MSTLVKYNNSHIAPVSNVSIASTYAPDRNGRCISPTYNISLNGYLLANRGSPTSSGTFSDSITQDDCESIDATGYLNSLLTKHCALTTLFSNQYKLLQLGTTTSPSKLTAYPRVVDLTIDDTTNFNYWPYTVNFEAENLYCGESGTPIWDSGCSIVKSYDDNWDISYDEAEVTAEYGHNRLFRISHTISAVGAVTMTSGIMDNEPWENAKSFVQSNSSTNAVIPATCIEGFAFSGDVSAISTNLYNFYETHTINKTEGSYSVTESWIYSLNPYIENYTVSVEESEEDAYASVGIDGTIRGFEKRVNGAVPASGSKFYNAKTRFNSLLASSGFLDIAGTLSGKTLDPYFSNGSVGRNVFNGEITYSYRFRERPNRLLPSAKREKITVSNTWGEDIYANLTILGRGELLQPINVDESGNIIGHKLAKSTLNIDATYPPNTGVPIRGPRYYTSYRTELQDVVNMYSPTGLADVSYALVDSQNETWDRNTGSYNYSLTWVIQLTGIC